MPWKCPECGIDGLDDRLSVHAIEAGGCGYVKFPAGVALVAAATGRETQLRVPTTIGQRVLRGLDPEGSRFASAEQFRLDRSIERGGWIVTHMPHATNPTCLNEDAIALDGDILKSGDSLSIKGEHLRLSVRLLD